MGNDINNYAQKFGMTNVLTPEEKATYREFAQAVHKMDNQTLFKLNIGSADELTSEQKDIVAWEIKIREIEALKRQNINPSVDFTVDKYYKNVPYDPEDPDLQKRQLEERTAISEMSDDLLRKSREIIENTPVRIRQEDLHKTMGGGVNMLAKKYVVEDNNGHEILVNNANIQEHFRKMYVKRMSEVTGIDYTRYDETSPDDIDYFNPNDAELKESPDLNKNDTLHQHINMDDYEDD
jgi:hypothetical protein